MTSDTTHLDASIDPRVFRKWVYVLIIAVAIAVQFVRIVNVTKLYNPRDKWPRNPPPHTPLLSANDTSRWDTVWSLAERQTFIIDEIVRHPGWNTIDKVVKDGHFYSSKPPLLPVGVAGIYWVLKRVTHQDLLQQPHGVVQTILLLINLLPFAISLALFSRLVERYARNDLTRIFLIVAAAFGTFLSTFLITFNNHTIAANCVLWSLCPALRICVEGDRRWYWFALSGFFAGFAVAAELPAAVFLAGIGLLLLRADLGKTLAIFSPAAALPLIAHLGLTVVQTGGFSPFYAGTETSLYHYQGSYWNNPQGVDKNLDPFWLYFFHCTFGHHGIFTLTPIFLLAAWSWCTGAVMRHSQPNPEAKSADKPLTSPAAFHLLSLVCTVVVVAFYMTRTKQYNFGGVTSGLRWTFWLTPLWLWSMIPALDQHLQRPWFRRVCLILLAVSVFSATFPWGNPWRHPWLFQMLEQAGWIHYN